MPFLRSALACSATLVIIAACGGSPGDDIPGASAGAADAGGDGATAPAPSPAPSPTTSAADACEAKLGASRACYSGPAATRGKGRCKDGQLTCTSKGDVLCVGEVLPAPAEACNDVDDTCDGVVDDGFDKAASPAHCGACNKACAADEACVSGACQKRTESSCANGIDDDADGKADCADSECEAQACGAGCVCTAGVRVETACGDGLDNDGDGVVDCTDPSCAGEACGAGCACAAGAKHETTCSDGLDNDGDGLTDCADPECAAAACGVGCVCAGTVRRETICNDRIDNDGNNGADCADQADCPQGTVCTLANGTPGTCQSNRTCG